MLKHVGTVLFLIGCLMGGALIGSYWIHRKPGPAVPANNASARPFGGELPQIRGIDAALTLHDPIEQWKTYIAHIHSMGGNWLSLDWPADAFSTNESTPLNAIVQAANDAGLKCMLVVRFRHGVDGHGLAVPPAPGAIAPALYCAAHANVNVVALYPGMGDSEPADGAWSAFIADVRKICPVPLCYVADFAGCARVSWWTQCDYAGIRGPIELNERPDAKNADETLNFLENSWRARQDLVASLHLRDNVPVIFLNIQFAGASNRTVLSYEAAIENSRGTALDEHGNTAKTIGTSWLAGVFLHLPPGNEAQSVEDMIQTQWK